jgi:hypothetical protein
MPLMRPIALLAICVLAPCLSARADEPFIRWTGELRVRGELDGRDFLSRTPPNAYTLLRTRFGAEITPLEKVRIVLTMQDARVFGEEQSGSTFSTIANTRNLDLLVGYVRIDDLFVDGFSVSAGRMGLSYGSERLIGTVGWNNVGRSFDGVLLRMADDVSALDMFVMNTGETNIPPAAATPASVASARDSGGLFSGLYFSLQTASKRHYDVYLLHEWDRRQSVRDEYDLSRFTAGTLLRGTFEQVRYEGEFAFQFGTRMGGTLAAYLLSLAAGYNFGQEGLTSAGLGFDYLTGRRLGSLDFSSFEPMFHTGHKFYGYMDYFISIPAHTFGRGLQDMYLDVTLKPSEASSVLIRAHNFMLAEPWSGNRDLGQELDIVGTLHYNEHVAFDVGASTFIPSTVMRAWFNGADAAWWGYLSTLVWF